MFDVKKSQLPLPLERPKVTECYACNGEGEFYTSLTNYEEPETCLACKGTGTQTEAAYRAERNCSDAMQHEVLLMDITNDIGW